MKKEKKQKSTLARVADIAFYVLVGGFIIYKLFTMNPKVRPNTHAADFTAPNILNNSVIHLSNYSNKVVLLNFWATWCPACRREIPDLIRLQKDMPEKVQVIGISMDRGGIQKVIDYAREKKITYPVIMGNFPEMNLYGAPTALPTTLVINRQGLIVKKMVGIRTYFFFKAAVNRFGGK